MRSRSAKKPRYDSQPCATCNEPTPVEQPGWVVLLDRRLICGKCYAERQHQRTPWLDPQAAFVRAFEEALLQTQESRGANRGSLPDNSHPRLEGTIATQG